MLTLRQIQNKLKDRRLRVVAKEIGVSYPTLLSISQGKSKNPSYRIIQLICEYLEQDISSESYLQKKADDDAFDLCCGIRDKK